MTRRICSEFGSSLSLRYANSCGSAVLWLERHHGNL